MKEEEEEKEGVPLTCGILFKCYFFDYDLKGPSSIASGNECTLVQLYFFLFILGSHSEVLRTYHLSPFSSHPTITYPGK